MKSAFAICMLPTDALVYGCQAINDSESTRICQQDYGQEYQAYYSSNICTPELAAELLGIDLADMQSTVVEASCFTFQTGKRRGCSFWDYEPAYQFCSENYGDKYLPHHVSDNCQVEDANQEFGYISTKKLNNGLAPKLAEVEAIMTMMDREGMRESLAGLVSFQPVVTNEFYSKVMKGLLAKMSDINDILQQRSYQKINLRDEGAKQFVQAILRYINVVNRIHKVYAYVAHRNHKVIHTYKFENMNFLNLRLARPIALEILAHINLKVKTIDYRTIEIYQSEQNKQMYEYIALSEPKSKVDYAKLVNFLGIRENMTNLWAVDRMSHDNLLDTRVRGCGHFMSLQGVGPFKHWPAIKENKVYDVFYTDYLAREEKLIEAIKPISLLEPNDISLIEKIYQSNKGISQLVQQYNSDPKMISNYLAQDFQMINDGIELDWEQFVTHHFRTFVMPGDGILNANNIKEQIFDKAYHRKVESLVHAYSGLYPWISDDDFDQLEKNIREYAEAHIKNRFEKKIKEALSSPLESYNNPRRLVRENYRQKVKDTYEVAKKYARLGALGVQMDNKSHFNVRLQPSSVDQLMLLFENKLAEDFHDVKLTLEKNEKMAGVLSDFFSKVIEKFNEKYLEQVGYNQFELLGSDEERALALWNALYDTAREYYRKNRFEISEYALVPEATLLARDHNAMARNPYTVQVYRDGTPVTVTIEEFYAAFQEDLNVTIPRSEIIYRTSYLMGIKPLHELGGRNNRDRITDGTFGRPLNYVSLKGSVRFSDADRNLGYQALKRLYLRSMDFTKQEIAENLVLRKEQEVEREEFEADYYDDVEVIKESKTLFARVFELFEIPMGSIASGHRDVGFRLKKKDKEYLIKSELSKAYGAAPLLRNEIKTREKKKEWICTGKHCINMKQIVVHNDIERSLIQKIGYHAYSFDRDEVNEVKAKELIRAVISQAEHNVKGKLELFCASDYMNYEDDENFKKMYRASRYIRATLGQESGTSLSNAKKIREFDEAVEKDIRSFWEGFTQDYLEPTVMILGLVTLVAVGVMLSIGSMGTAAPAALTATSAYIGMFLSASNYVFLPLIIATTFSRVNTQFIEVPAQLKFQTSLAHSQVDFSKVADYDLIEEKRRQNRVESYWTIGFMPLDLYFGYTVGAQLRSSLGLTGVKAYQKLTGIKLRRFSAPPQSLRGNQSYRALRREHGFIKGTLKAVGQVSRNLRARLPRYQALPESMIKTMPLRMGIARKLKELSLHTKPWVINKEIKAFRDQLQGRLKTYQKYLVEEAKVIEQVQLQGRLKMSELMEHGMKYTRLSFTIKSFFKAIKEGRALEYLGKYGEVMAELKRLQGELIQNNITRLNTLIDKIDEFHRLKGADEALIHGNTQNVDELLRLLTDEEIMLLQKIAKKSKGGLKELKSVFKTHEELLKSLRPYSYLYGHAGVDFARGNSAAVSFLGDDAVHAYTFKSDSEDIVSFYETMLRQNAFDDEVSKLLRRTVEERVSRFFILDQKGARIYP